MRLGEVGIYEAPEPGEGGANLRRLFRDGVDYLRQEVPDPGLQALLYTALAIRAQFYFDGNERTARWMMNGQLMAGGYEPIGIPVTRRKEWNTTLITLFTEADATGLMRLLAECQFSRIEEQNRAAGLTFGYPRPTNSP